MFCYAAYGLTIHSELELPELHGPAGAREGAPPAAEAVVRLAAVDRPPPAEAEGGDGAWACPGLACFHFLDIGTFRISAGREITLDPADGADPRLQRLILLGPVLAVLLHQRGLLVLHASAVALRTQERTEETDQTDQTDQTEDPEEAEERDHAAGTTVAVAFVGDKGAGKSTTAAALHARGHGLISDDVVAVDLSGPVPLVRPGFPHLKLWPEAAASTLDGAEAVAALPRVHPDLEKRSRPAFAGFPRTPLPLAAVYALAPLAPLSGPASGGRDAIEPARGQEAFLHLVRHSYMAQLLRATRGEALHFRQSVQLARTVPVRRLTRRRDLCALPALARRIERDARDAALCPPAWKPAWKAVG